MSIAIRPYAEQVTMQRVSIVVIAVCIGLYISACGGSDGPVPSPSTVPAPSEVPASPQVSVEIVGPRVVPTGSDVLYSATAKLTNGVVTNARPTTWTVDNVDVASIKSAPDGSGGFSAKQAGMVTLTATYQGHAGTLTVEVRGPQSIQSGANLEISFTPNPVPGRQRQCVGPDPGIPSWTFTETITETLGVGFTQENVSFTLYDDTGKPIYSDTFAEEYYFPPRSVFSEEFCSSLFANLSGFYADVYEGVDDLGNRRAFAGGRLRLLPVAATTAPAALFATPPQRPIVRGSRRRVR